jgi:hypothetical protein
MLLDLSKHGESFDDQTLHDNICEFPEESLKRAQQPVAADGAGAPPLNRSYKGFPPSASAFDLSVSFVA